MAAPSSEIIKEDNQINKKKKNTHIAQIHH